MTKKIIIVVVIIIAFVILGVVAYWVLPEKFNFSSGLQTEYHGENIIKDNFSLTLPTGWIESSAPMGTVFMAVNSNREPGDARAKTTNFHDYLTITLDSSDEDSSESYLQIVQNELSKAVPDIKFISDRNLEINSNKAQRLDSKLNQNQIDFALSLYTIYDKNSDDVWILSFNTTQSDWPQTKNEFSNIANSFLIRSIN